MSSEKEDQLVRFICDNCDEQLEINSHSFKDAWESARDDHGWRTFKDNDGEWQHRCKECRGL